MQALEGVGGLGQQGRVAEIPLGQLAAAADQQRRVHVQLAGQPQMLRRLWLAHSLEHTHESLGGAELLWFRLVSQPVAAGLARGRGWQSPATVDAREHLAGLPP